MRPAHGPDPGHKSATLLQHPKCPPASSTLASTWHLACTHLGASDAAYQCAWPHVLILLLDARVVSIPTCPFACTDTTALQTHCADAPGHLYEARFPAAWNKISKIMWSMP